MEDFKKVQAGLEEKFKSNQEQILRNEENVDEILKDIKRKIEFDKEMYFKLSFSFCILLKQGMYRVAHLSVRSLAGLVLSLTRVSRVHRVRRRTLKWTSPRTLKGTTLRYFTNQREE